MKAIVLYGPGDVRLADFPEKEMTENDVRIRVLYCGICGSDFHKVAGKKNTHPVHYPVPLGHEISGIVEAVGKNVTHFQVGDHVTADPNHSCGKCRYCQAGKPSFCEKARGVVKGMAEFVIVPEENVYRLPAGVSQEMGALAEPLSCCLHGIDLLGVQAGENVALVGYGAIGAMMLPLLRRAGAAKIAVLELSEERRAMALQAGADYAISPTDTADIEALCEQLWITKVMECVGITAAQETALQVAGFGATVVLFGVGDSAARLPLSTHAAFLKELVIKTSYINPHTMERALLLLASGAFKKEQVIAKELSMQEAVEEFHTPTHSKKGKVLVRIASDTQ